MKFVDDCLNGITMYRLILYVLIFLVGIATLLSFFKLLPFSPISLLLSTGFLVIVCYLTNFLFAKVFKVPTNFESAYITALILSLILTPINTFHDALLFLVIGIISQASKYILAIKRKHLFNPTAFAVALTAFALNYSASWWVGTAWMIPFVLVSGILIVRKIRRFYLVFSFLLTTLILILVTPRLILDTPILFFAFVMLTEPQTTPPTKIKQILYGGLVGIGFLQITPEIALLVGNIFSFIVSPKEKLLLALKEKIPLTPDIYEFVFGLDKRLNFLPGQYLEWTLGYKNPDSRGNRRYFTIASSPTEANLHLGIKFYPDSSSFKKKLISLSLGDKIIAGQLSGEFTLPKDPNKKLVFIAGGIGVTPYRSILKYLLDISQRRDIVLIFSNKTPAEVVYKNIFDEADQKLGIKTYYVFGHLEIEFITKKVPDYKDRIFYISGPHSMVDAFEKTLKDMGVPGSQIKIDFFPGYV